MKKNIAILMSLWLSILSAKEASAICLCGCSIDCSPVGAGVQIDYFTDVAAALQVGESDKLLSNMKDQLTSTLNIQDVIAHAGMKGMGLVGTKFNKAFDKIAGKKVTSASRLIEEPKNVDLNSEQAVQAAFIERFLQYPSSKQKTNDEYEKIGEQFKIDTTLEMYIIAREMEKEIEQKLKQLEQIESCIIEGIDCAVAGFDESENCENSKEQEDELCLWRANLMVARLYDQIMWYNEFLLAMDAQYNAVMSIGTKVKIRKHQEEDKEEKTSVVEFLPQIQTAEAVLQWQVFFADSEWFEGTPEDRQIKTKDGFDIMDRAGGYSSSLAGRQETFASLQPLSDAQTATQMAIRAHNVKSQLDSFKQIYEAYNDMKRYRAKVREHLTLSEECIRNYVGQYYQNPFQSWVGKNCGRYQDKMYCPYTNNEAQGLGLYDINCPNNPSHRCYVTELADTTGRSGLSGYLLALYDESKKQAAVGEVNAYLTEDNETAGKSNLDRYVVMKEDSSREERQARKNNLSISANTQSDNYAVKNPNDQEAMVDEIRMASRLNWLNGSLVSKAMVRDLNGKQGGKFGAVKNRYPLWNDQKEFYDQYINGKYENIKEYIATSPLSNLILAAARVANEIIEYPTSVDTTTGQQTDVRASEAEAIETLANNIKNTPQEDSIATIVAEEKAYLQNMIRNHENKKAEIKQKIYAEGKRIEKLNMILDTNNRDYNEQDRKMDYAEDTSGKDEEGIRIEQQMYQQRAQKKGEESDASASPFTNSFKQNISENDEIWAQAATRRDELNNDTQSIEQEIAERQANIAQLKETLNAEIKTYVKQYSDAVIDYQNRVNEVAEEAGNSVVYDLIAEAAGEVSAIKVANDVAACVRQKILRKVEEAEKKLHDMQATSEIYYADNTGKIQSIHNDMIQSILDMGKVTKLTPEESCGNNLTDEILAEMSMKVFVKALLDMCEDDYCTTPEPADADGPVYFVGKKGKPRDFRTPTGPLDFASAPLREIFYFDEVDFDNVEKYYEGDEEPVNNQKLTITGEGFLNSGAEIPEVWRYILRVRPFVEREIDLEQLLTRGKPELAFSRSGIFPCRLNGQIFDAAYNNEDIPYTFGYNVANASENVIMQQCVLLHDNGGRLIDTETDYAEIIKMPVSEGDVRQTSELGQILAYVPEYVTPIQIMFMQIKPPSKLSFNQAFLSSIHSQDNFGDDESPEAMEQFRYGARAMFTHNQFGDYLDFIEKDKAAEENLLESQKQVEEIHQKLKEIFNEFGDTISDDLDLADEDDYDMVSAALDGYKTAYMRNALENLLKVKQMTTVESVQEKADVVQHQIELLTLDDEEIVELSGSEEMSELEYSLKEHTANKEISDAYDNRAREEMEKQIRQLQKPYCAVYAK